MRSPVVLVVFLVAILWLGQNNVLGLTPEQRLLIDQVVQLYMTDNHVPGMGLSIVEKKGENVLSIGYGRSRIETNTPATSQTLFAIGSITKSVTSVMVVKVLSEKYPHLGELVLDMPIVQLAPSFNFTFSDRFRSEYTSFRDLLSHRTCLASSGIDVLLGMNPDIIDYNYRSRYEPEMCSFRTMPVYNNNLYSLAGSLIAEIAGTTFEQLVNDFFTQLKMVDSRLVDAGGSYEQHPRMSHAYYRKDNETFQFNTMHLRRLAVVAGGGAILSTARDMSQYVQFHLNRGRVGDVQIVPEHALNWMYKSAVSLSSIFVEVEPLGRTGIYGYGLGLLLRVYEGNPWIAHGGYFPPYESMFAIFPEQGFGLFFTINGPGTTGLYPGQISQQVLQLLIFEIVHGNLTNLSNLDYSKYTLQKNDHNHVAGDSLGKITINGIYEQRELSSGRKVRRVEPEDIVGVYGNPADGQVTISVGSDLALSINFGSWGLGTLAQLSDTLFSLEWISPVNEDSYAGGPEAAVFTLDFSIADEFHILQDGGANGYVSFYKDRTIDTVPPIPWEPDSCGPTPAAAHFIK